MPRKTSKTKTASQKQVIEEASEREDAQHQVYDNVVKRLIEVQFTLILPILFSMLKPVTNLRELNIELLIPPRRSDRIYLARTKAGWVILHIEIEMSPPGRGRTSRR